MALVREEDAVPVVGRVLIVQQVVGPGSTVARVECFVRQRGQVVHDGRHSWLGGVEAVGIGCVALVSGISQIEAVLLIPVVAPRVRVGIAHLQRRRGGGIAIGVAIHQRCGRPDGNGVRPRPSQYELVIVVAHGVGIGQRGKIRHVSRCHVVEAHRYRTLKGGLVGEVRRRRRVLQSPANGSCHPREQVGGASAGVGTGNVGARGGVSAGMERDIALQKLGEADAAYRQVDQDRVETERRIASLGEQLKSFPSRSVTIKRWADNPEVLEKMKTHLLELQLKRTELLTRFEPSYRLVQEVDLQIAETQASIAAEALTPVRDETTDKDPNYEWARMEMEKDQVQRDGLRARQSDAFSQVASLRMFAQQMQSDSMDQQDLMRAAKADEDNYLLYLHKREEARIGDALDERRILNVAIVEAPVAPALAVHSLLVYFLLAFGLAMAFSVGIAFTSDYFGATIRTPSEAYRLLEVPVLAWLPESEPVVLRPAIYPIGRPKVVIQ